jgi:hypothetical protein
MTSSPFLCVAAFSFVLHSLTVAQTAPQQQTVLPIGSAIVIEIKGEVVFTSPEGASVLAQRGVTLSADSKVETAKGSVLLMLQDGSQILIKAHSNVVLRAPNQGKGFSLELFLGKIMAKIQKRMEEAPSFRMGTPSAVITVRGTRFSVEVTKKQKTYVQVFEGQVEVRGIAEGSPGVLVRPGFSTDVGYEGSPEDPRQMSPNEGNQREGGRENEGPGAQRSNEDQQRNQTQPRSSRPGEDSGKPD